MSHVKRRDSTDTRRTQALDDLAGRIGKTLGTSAELATKVPGLLLYRNTAPTPPNHCTYEPSLLVIPRGKKRIELAKKSYVFGQDKFLLTSVELPIISQVIVASAKDTVFSFLS